MGKLLANKGLFFSTLILVLFFLACLCGSLILQNKVIKDAAYVDKFSTLSLLLSSEATGLIDELERFRQGGVDPLQGEIMPIDEFLSPIESNIEATINNLRNGNEMAASNTYKNTLLLLQQYKESKLDSLRYQHLAAMNIAILLFLFTVIPSILKLSSQKQSIVVAKQETAGILNTVSEGLFLLDKDHHVGQEQSASLSDIFRAEQNVQGDFFEWFGQYVPESTVQAAKDYVDLMFGDRVPEELEQNLNPLHDVEINVIGPSEKNENRYVDFHFSPVMQDDIVSHLQGSVTDVTRRVKLEREVARSREQREVQLELLTSLLKADHDQLHSFFDTAERSMSEIIDFLESPGFGHRRIKTRISRFIGEIHRLKEQSVALGLHNFEFIAHSLQEELEQASKEVKIVAGNNLLPAIDILKEMFLDLENMQSLANRFAVDIPSANSLNNHEVEDYSTDRTEAASIVSNLQQLASRMGDRTGKQVNLVCYGLKPENVPEHLTEKLSSIALQLVRNSITHGCLSPTQRLANGKSDFINIRLSFSEQDDAYALIVRDDGEGFDENRILNQAVQRNILNQDEADNIDPSQVLRLAFYSGFSTLSESGVDSAKGTGLYKVRRIVKEMGGRVSLRHRVGEFSQFHIVIPK